MTKRHLQSVSYEKGIDPNLINVGDDIPEEDLHMRRSSARQNKARNRRIRKIGIPTLAIAATAGLSGGVYAATRPDNSPVAALEYTIQPNDDLWGLVRDAYPNEDDPSSIVNRIKASMPDDGWHEGGIIQPGDVVIFPADAVLNYEKEHGEVTTKSIKGRVAEKLPILVTPEELKNSLKSEKQ